MRSPAPLALSIAVASASVFNPAVASARQPDVSVTLEVIVRDDVPRGSAPSFEVVETDWQGLSDLVNDGDDSTSVEVNGSAWITDLPADPEAATQWGLEASGVVDAWDDLDGDSDAIIAILDTGVGDGANLGDRRLAGESFVEGDPHVDPTGHGSWVAALAAASHDDIGIAGVCPTCTILPVQVGDHTGRVPWSAAADGITWAVDQGADIINLSFGGSIRSETLADAVAYAVANDVIVVGAAGNSGSTDEFYPAALPGVISVAAHDPDYAAYRWTNRGDWVDVAAPGCSTGVIGDGYGMICGTSFAAPMVSAIIGLYIGEHGRIDPATAETAIDAAATPLDFVESGWIDAAELLETEPLPADGPPRPHTTFTDVAEGAYYATPVAWLTETGATSGTSPTTFSPNDSVTRGQLATFLWRLHGQPAVDVANPFDDVAPTAYYTDPVLWLASTGVTTGTSPTTFSPDDTVTRGQLATFLWRLEGQPALGADTSFSSFTDVAPTAYYGDAVAWLAASGMTEGTSPTTFSPTETVTRGQLATFLWRRAHPGG